jgi:hypothetical protein
MADSAPVVSPTGQPEAVHPSRRPLPVWLARAALAAAALALVAVLVRAWSLDANVANIDYYQYWLVGRALRAGEAQNIYRREQRVRLAQAGWSDAQLDAQRLGHDTLRRHAADFRKNELGTYSTPWLYTAFAWSSGDDYDADQLRFQRTSLLLFAGSVLLLARMARLSPLATLVLTACLVAGFAPALSEGRVGNVNRIQLALLTLCLLALRGRGSPARWAAAGFVLALAVLFKPNLGAVAALLAFGWLLTRRLRELHWVVLGALAGGILVVGVSSWYFSDAGIWLRWLREVPPLLSEFDHNLRKGNFSLVRVAKDAFGWGDSRVFSAAFLLGVIAVALAARRKGPVTAGGRTRAAEGSGTFLLDFALLGVGAILPLLASDLAWLHYFVLTVPLFVFALRPRPGEPSLLRRALPVLALAALGLVAGEPLRRLFGEPSLLVTAALTIAGALGLYAIGLVEIFDQVRASRVERAA